MTAVTSSAPPMPLLRQYTTFTKDSLTRGRMVEYSNNCTTRLPPLGGASVSHPTSTVREVGSRHHSKTPVYSTTASYGSHAMDKKKRLERMNLRGEHHRRNSRSSATPKTNSSCKRSDSTNNDSQRSALTTESTDNRVGGAVLAPPPPPSDPVTQHASHTVTQHASHTVTQHASHTATTSNSNSKSKAADTFHETSEQNLTEDELEQRRNYAKCMDWVQKLPARFSGMHIAQERAPSMVD